MNFYLYIILAYLLALTGYNIYRSRKITSQEDFMVAGRSLSLTKMVFTLVCTWIGSGTFIAGAEYASYAGWSAIWQPAGAFLGIAIIYFVAGKIRTFGQYTVGDILEVRYGKFARLFGAIALIIAFTTIVAYQFRAGGYILNVISDGKMSVESGQIIAAVFVIGFVAIGGMVAVAHTDLPNGIIIVSSCLLAVPFVIAAAGGWAHAHAVLPASRFEVFPADFGKYPPLKALAYFLSTLMLLMGVQSMYQKFYAARSPREAKKAVAIWIVGTIVVETIVIAIAVFASVYSTEHGLGWDGRALVLNAARYMTPGPVGVLLLAAACAVVLSTGMNYLLSSSSNVMRDIYQGMINPKADPAKMVALQKVFIVVMGLCAFLLIFVPTYLKSQVSVLQYLVLRLHDVRRGRDAGAVRGADLEAGDAPGRRGVDRRRRAGDRVLRSGAAEDRARRDGGGAGRGRGRRVRRRPLGHPQHLPVRDHLDWPARRGQPDDAAAEARGTGEAVPRRCDRGQVAGPALDVVAWPRLVPNDAGSSRSSRSSLASSWCPSGFAPSTWPAGRPTQRPASFRRSSPRGRARRSTWRPSTRCVKPRTTSS